MTDELGNDVDLEYNRDEEMILNDLLIMIAVTFETRVAEVKEALKKLGGFDELIMCLLCAHTLELSLEEVLTKYDDEDFIGHMEQAKSRYMNPSWN